MNLFKTLLAQLFGWIITVFLFKYFPGLLFTQFSVVLTQGLIASLCSALLRQPWWWLLIHLLFFPIALALLTLNIHPHIYLLIFGLCLLIFWKTASGNVPLFLSSKTVSSAIARHLINRQTKQFTELGAGIGSVTVPLAKQLPQINFSALEYAPLPWLILKLRSLKLANIAIHRQNFWEYDLKPFDVVFVFLSPAVMSALGQKALQEMRPGSLLISSSFPIDDWVAEQTEQLDDQRSTILFFYRIPACYLASALTE